MDVIAPAAVRTAPSFFARRAAEESASGGRAHQTSPLRGIRVLIVDDEPDARELLSILLEDEGCVVCSAASVIDAMACIPRFAPDILLSDIAMPDEDGYALIRRVRALSRELGGEMPAAAITAYAGAEDRRRALASGFSLHLPKPVDHSQLLLALTALVELLPRSGSAE